MNKFLVGSLLKKIDGRQMMWQKALTVFLALPLFFALATKTYAQTADLNNLTCAGIVGIIQSIINLLYTAAGIVFFFVLIIGGGMYLTSGGNPEAMQRAQQTLLWGVVGVVITVAMVFITTSFFQDALGIDTGVLFNIQGLICG